MSASATASYLTMQIHDIIAGRVHEAVAPGWAIGPFYPIDDPRHSPTLEIKHWDRMLVRRTWRNHPTTGSEYIVVSVGVLEVVFGERDGPDDVRDSLRVTVRAGTCIVLKEGQWRRFECSDDACGISIRGAPARS